MIGIPIGMSNNTAATTGGLRPEFRTLARRQFPFRVRLSVFRARADSTRLADESHDKYRGAAPA
jgi:hypothetical protein